MPMGSSRVGGLLLSKGATESGGPEGRNFRLHKKAPPDVISHNKGQSNERLAQAVWARAIARRRLAREVGSEEKKEEGCQRKLD